MSARIRSLSDFLTQLKGVKRVPDGQYMALCPGHHDNNPSLRLKEADGKILIKCFAGCELMDILKPLGLEPKDLFLNSHKAKSEQKKIVAIYDYVDEKGNLLHQTVRYEPKEFSQRRPDKNGKWIWNLKGARTVLYRLPEVLKAIEDKTSVFHCEGEKDCDRLRAVGLVATTNPMGAGKWGESYSEALRGADLIIIPDNDSLGRDHVNRVARGCYGIAKRIRVLKLPSDSKDVSDWLDNGGDVEQLKQLVATCPDYEPPPEATLPEIVVTDRHLRDITANALEALYRANRPERIFRRGGVLTRLSVDEKGSPFTETLNESALRGYLARSCNFVRVRAKGEKIATPPPLDVVRDIDSLGDWQFPPLLGITEAPVIRTDGTVMTKPGYDNATNLYYWPSPKLSVPLIQDKPTDSDLKVAIDLALEPLADFPFDSEASKANAIATMLTPVLRPLVDGPVPMALFDKPQQGTGASLLAEVISLVATGRTAAILSAPQDDESWRKEITSLLLRGQLVVTVDNIEATLSAPSLGALLTSSTWQDRLLGHNKMVTIPNRAIWIGTGNNIRLAGDLPRRCYRVRMDPGMARPWMRPLDNFRHPYLVSWVFETRGAILAAILTIDRAWVVAGIPESPGVPSLGGFEQWRRVIGGVLQFMGIGAFLRNLESMYDEMDTETSQWESFLEAWHDVIGDKAVTAAELIGYLNDNTDLRVALPDAMADMEARNYSVRLGQRLAKRNGVRYPSGFILVKAGEKKRAVTWKVVRFENITSPQFSFKGEVGEVQNTPAREKNNSNNNENLGRNKTETTSPNLTPASKIGEVDIPDYPTHPCHNCGFSDYWLTDWNTWLCQHCHPKPEGTGK